MLAVSGSVAASLFSAKVPTNMKNNSILSVCDVSHRYAKDWAIRNISFDIEKTGVIGLLGSNGAGKSTLMNVICGALHATIGEVTINGHSIRHAPMLAKQRLGFLPQQAPLHLDLTVDEYLTFCAGLRRIDQANITRSIDEAKARVGVSHFSCRLIRALSGGYRQRVGIAGAILHKPDLVVFDEPTNGLDPVQIAEVRQLIKDIAADRAVLISTHIMPEVEALCDTIKMIENGRVVFNGGLENYLAAIKSNCIVARFLAPPQKSLIEELPLVKQVEELNPGRFRLTFLGDPNEASEAIISIGRDRNWRPVEVVVERASLEQVFASFSNQGSTGAPGVGR